MAGNITAKAGRLKLAWEGLDLGNLGAFEALEILALGIQGTRILWAMLELISPSVPEWNALDFASLERAAVSQRDLVEERRLKAGLAALLPDGG